MKIAIVCASIVSLAAALAAPDSNAVGVEASQADMAELFGAACCPHIESDPIDGCPNCNAHDGFIYNTLTTTCNTHKVKAPTAEEPLADCSRIPCGTKDTLESCGST